jgi:hypothetical protein
MALLSGVRDLRNDSDREQPTAKPNQDETLHDHTVPASLSHKQYEKYEKSEAQTDYIHAIGISPVRPTGVSA